MAFTPTAFDERTKAAFAHLEHLDDGRIVFAKVAGYTERSDYWKPIRVYAHADDPSGILVMVRSADCGADCRCGAEIRLL